MTLEPLPGVDPIRALRWVLKGLLRQHGMKCISIHEEKHDHQSQPHDLGGSTDQCGRQRSD
jgi:hypothetical protein